MKLLCVLLLFFSTTACAENITPAEAIKRAEFFIGQNGYTNWPDSKIKRNLDYESIEHSGNYRDILRHRFNTLKPKAIGISPGRKSGNAGWSVGFDFVSPSRGEETCRVVTMNPDGSDIRIEHVDGVRKYFAGFTPPKE